MTAIELIRTGGPGDATRRRRGRLARRWFLSTLAVAACARGPAAPPPAAPVPVVPETAGLSLEASFGRPGLRPVPVPPSFERAVEAGTRTLDGRPGPSYWQQWVNYRIDAALDPVAARVDGQQTIVYHNRSPDALPFIVIRLYQNLFAPGAQRTRQVPVTSGMTVERIVIDGVEAVNVSTPAASSADALYVVDGTIMTVRLPEPLQPRDSAVIEMSWHFEVPPAGAPRMGHINRRLFTIAQWYPQIAVYDDLRGWHTDPYLGNGEFYLEYGNFEVALTVPEGWLVAATGTLLNPEEVLTEEARNRLRLATTVDTVVHVVTADSPGGATQQAPGGQLTWYFRADSVRDFAFAASPEYVWDAVRARVGGTSGQPRYALVQAFYRPESTSWRRAAEFARHAMEFHAERWAPYPYPQLTTAEGPVGGMEYPMMLFVADFGSERTLYEVTNHEVAHQWYPMLVGSNENGFAWQDEGLATYIEDLATMDFFPGTDPFANELFSYTQIAGTEAETPLMRHADLHGPYSSFVIAAYTKPALMLRALAGMFGPDAVRRALAEYASSWSFRHPSPIDFFRTFDRVLGERLDWFWCPWWYETGVLDQAIGQVVVEPVSGGERVSITVEDRGDNPMPILLAIATADGGVHEVRVPVDVWFDGSRQHTTIIEAPAPVTRIAIDPDAWFPDVNRSNNTWARGVLSP